MPETKIYNLFHRYFTRANLFIINNIAELIYN